MDDFTRVAFGLGTFDWAHRLFFVVACVAVLLYLFGA